MHKLRMPLKLGAIFFALTITLAAQAKRPLNHRDYDGWNSIQAQVLSRDGKFLAYELRPEDGDGWLVVRNLTTGKELRENAGSPPPAQDNTDQEAGAPQGGGAGRGIRIEFTHDGKYAIASAFPPKADTEKARKDKKPAGEMPRNSMIIVDITTMTATRVADVASFQVPENGASFVAYLKGPKASANAEPATGGQNDSEVDQRGGRGGRGGGGRGGRNEYGSDLMVRDLTTAKERTAEDVLEYSIAKDAKTLVYAVSSKKDDTNGVYAIVPGSDAAANTLLAGKGKYSHITWDLSQKQLAFVSDHDDPAAKPAKFGVYLWARNGAASEVISSSVPGFKSGYAIYDRGQLSFSRDGARLFVSSAPAAQIAAATPDATPVAAAPGDEKVLADLWHWKDDFVQPMQKVRAAQERSRSYRGVYNIATKQFIQLADPTMATVNPTDDAKLALGTDDREYRHMVDYDGTYNDVYLVDTDTGARKLALKQFRGGGGGGGGGRGGLQISPDGRYGLVFKDRKWWSIETSDLKMTDLSGKLGPAFYDESHDTPDEPGSYGTAGWTKDGKWALITMSSTCGRWRRTRRHRAS